MKQKNWPYFLVLSAVSLTVIGYYLLDYGLFFSILFGLFPPFMYLLSMYRSKKQARKEKKEKQQ